MKRKCTRGVKRLWDKSKVQRFVLFIHFLFSFKSMKSITAYSCFRKLFSVCTLYIEQSVCDDRSLWKFSFSLNTLYEQALFDSPKKWCWRVEMPSSETSSGRGIFIRSSFVRFQRIFKYSYRWNRWNECSHAFPRRKKKRWTNEAYFFH